MLRSGCSSQSGGGLPACSADFEPSGRGGEGLDGCLDGFSELLPPSDCLGVPFAGDGASLRSARYLIQVEPKSRREGSLCKRATSA